MMVTHADDAIIIAPLMLPPAAIDIIVYCHAAAIDA